VAWLAARLTGRRFTLAAHAGADLYRTRAFLAEKVRDAGFVAACVRGNAEMLRTLAGPGARVEWIYHGVDLSRFDGVRYGHRTLQPADILSLYQLSREEGFGAEVKRRILLGTYVLSSGYYDAYYNKAQKVRTLIRRDFENAFQQVDAIVSPIAPSPARKIGECGNPLEDYLADVCTIPVNLAGLPAISVPLPVSVLPIGLQIITPHLQEALLLRIAHAVETR
jgi:Asp-tRNA(Asn)/Glu-tRNA(Gln) amidotransferase A subunit family amidase